MPATKGKNQHNLDSNEILIAEFEYSSNVTLQSNEELSKVTNIYLVALGSVVAGILGLNTENFNIDFLNRGLSLIAIFFSLFSVLIITQLARVRFTWFDSIEAMKRIKDYYMAKDSHLKQAFYWNDLPKKYKLGSSSSVWAIFVAFLGGGSAFAGTMLAGFGNGKQWWPAAVFIGIIFFLFQLWTYKRGLGDK